MSLSAAAMRLLAEKGLSLDDVIAVAAANEADRVDTAAEKRKAYDRERKAKKRNSTGFSTGHNNPLKSADSTGNSTGIPPETPPLAGVRDKPLTKVLSGGLTTAADASARDDWPDGSVKDHAAQLCEICNTARLDLSRQGGLAMTLPRLGHWRTAGASWEFDVVPVVQALVARAKRPITTWKYFDDAVAESVAANRQALTIPEAENITQIRPGTGPPRQSITDRIADENQQVRDRLSLEIERRNGRPN